MATLKEKFINALFGTPVQVEGVAPSVSYGDKIDEYLNSLGSQPYMQGLLNQPKETGLTLDQYKQGVANGLNYGIPEIAKRQDELGIRKPQTGEEIYQARLGDFNQPTTLNIGTSYSPRQGGFLNDLASGFRENTTENFDIQNLAPDGNKGVATRLGEGLGSLVSLYNKPIGRGLLAGAAALALGGGGADALAYGLGTGIGRQTNMTKDKAYRQNLQQMGYTQEEIDSIPGILTDDIYKNLVDAKQAEIMANYRNDMLKATQENQGIMNQIRLQNLANNEKQNAMQNYFKGQELDLKRKDLEIKERNAGKNKAAFQKYRQAVKDRNDAIQQIKDLRTAIKANPNSLGLIVGSLAKGGTVAQKFANEQLSKNPESIKTRAAVAKLRGTTMHDLLGSAQTLTEQKNLIPFLPDATDNAKTALAKLDQLEKELLREQNSMNIYGNEMGWNYDDMQGEELENLDPLDPLGVL